MDRIKTANITRFSTEPTLKKHLIKKVKVSEFLVCLVLALMANCTVHAEQLSAEIGYYKDDNITNQIPYFDNRFRIDAQLDEVTLIFYRRDGAQPVILVRPDGTKFKINETPSEKVQWYDDSTYDMIRIKSPMVGPWQVIGDVDPASKIMVVSEIKLEVTPLPKIILQGETIKLVGRIFNGDLAIDNPLFSEVLKLDVDFESTNNTDFDNFGAKTVKLASFRDDGMGLDEHAKDSLFTGEFELNFAPGEWQPIYFIKMPMATRKLMQSTVIVQKNPISISTEPVGEENGINTVTFNIDDSFVKADSVLIQGKITFADKTVEKFSITDGKGISRTYQVTSKEPGIHRINISVFGETTNDREFRAIVPEFSFNVSNIAAPIAKELNTDGTEMTAEQKKAQEIAKAAAAAEKRAQELAAAKAQQEAEVAAKEQETLIYIVVGNTVVVLIAGILFLVMRRRKTKK